MRRTLLVAALLAVAPVGLPVARAGALIDGYRAYDGGDYGRALAAWRRAAKSGDAAAMTAIASLYMHGEGVPREAARALDWYRRAAALGDAVAQLNLGDMLARGVGAPADSVAAHVWLSLAARQGMDWAAARRDGLQRTMSPAAQAAARARLEAYLEARSGVQ